MATVSFESQQTNKLLGEGNISCKLKISQLQPVGAETSAGTISQNHRSHSSSLLIGLKEALREQAVCRRRVTAETGQILNGLSGSIKPVWKSLKPASSLMTSRGRPHWFQKRTDCASAYEEMPVLLAWLVISAARFKSSPIQHDVHFVNGW